MIIKLEISGNIEVVTGMHIGGSSEFAAIGAVDSPVVRDTISRKPMIPGSSFKGKLRTLLAKKYNTEIAEKPDEDNEKLLKIFGCSEKGKIRRGRVLISDMFILNYEKIKERGLSGATEVKFENTINRVTAVAKPRQIERVIRGAEFEMNIIYEICYDGAPEDVEKEILEDINILADGFKLMKYDYLGGSGSRGYGKIKFNDLSVSPIIGDVSDEIISKCQESMDLVV